jgi:hypothetical protein
MDGRGSQRQNLVDVLRLPDFDPQADEVEPDAMRAILLVRGVMGSQPVTSAAAVDIGQSIKLFWTGFSGDGSIVPPGHTLQITALTFAFFPKNGGVIGRANISGRNAAGSSVWSLQTVYVPPLTTIHLPFPAGLVLPAGGHVEIGFLDDGPGTLTLDANGLLIG